jgi:hypothetical protein
MGEKEREETKENLKITKSFLNTLNNCAPSAYKTLHRTQLPKFVHM